jgi:protein-disulfide isomerase
MKRPAFDSCLTNQAINDGLIFVKQRGRALGVVATPTFFINGKKIRGGLSFEELQKEIDPLLAAPAAPPAQAQAPGRPA